MVLDLSYLFQMNVKRHSLVHSRQSFEIGLTSSDDNETKEVQQFCKVIEEREARRSDTTILNHYLNISANHNY